jgi:threonine/homoserine/homoserine lactone efflux protein
MSELPFLALLGFALAASPGPVNALAFARGLRDGASRTVLLTLGADTADILYATLVILGAGPYLDRPDVQLTLSIGGGLFLAQLGLVNLRAAWRAPSTAALTPARGSAFAAYREGFSAALLSPLTIVFWMSVFGGYYASLVVRGVRTSPVLMLGALMLGAALWTSVAAVTIHLSRKALPGRWYAVLVTLLSLTLLVFAARLLSTGLLTLVGHTRPRHG